MITKVEINKLFLRESFNYVIPLNEKDGVTIIHGPNGCGKTTFLKLLSWVAEKDFEKIAKVPFESMKFYFNTGYMEIKSVPADLIETNSSFFNSLQYFQYFHKEFIISINEGTKKKKRFRVSSSISRLHLRDLRQSENDLEYIGGGMFQNSSTGERFDEVDIRGNRTYKWDNDDCVPNEVSSHLERLKFELIETHRLYKIIDSDDRRDSYHRRPSGGKTHTLRVKEISLAIKKEIDDQILKYNATSSELDRTFPTRLLKFKAEKNLTNKEIARKHDEVESLRRDLRGLGILEDSKNTKLPDYKGIDRTMRKVLWLHLDDMKRKLNTLEGLKVKLELLSDILNKRFRYKKTIISQYEGIKFVIENGKNESFLSPSKLSSGEQHQLVLFYDLIFNTDDNSIILIDEPELSLHVDWQRAFLDDLIKVATINSDYFIVATHSPQIIGHKWESSIALDGGVEK
ncbi:MAG: ATP-binding protein [Bdellovibrionales bacterium]|nr:ATP-binding protein [Bdellovibrionales bacterium]